LCLALAPHSLIAMGLRLVAQYYDPVDAMVARGAVEAAGMLAILQNYEWLSVQPQYVGPLGGYRLVVSEFDLADAVSLLSEVAPVDSREGERLEVTGDVLDRVLSLLFSIFAGGAPLSVRQRRWVE